MKIRCLLGIHKYQPKRVFDTNVVSKTDIWVTSIIGKQCKFCGTRKLVVDKYQAQSPGASQCAFDWLHNEHTGSAEILRIVK